MTKFFVPDHITALTLEGHQIPLEEKGEDGTITILGIQPHHFEHLEGIGILPVHDGKPKKSDKIGALPSPEEIAADKQKLSERALKEFGAVLDKRKSLQALKSEVAMLEKGLKRAPGRTEE